MRTTEKKDSLTTTILPETETKPSSESTTSTTATPTTTPTTPKNINSTGIAKKQNNSHIPENLNL